MKLVSHWLKELRQTVHFANEEGALAICPKRWSLCLLLLQICVAATLLSRGLLTYLYDSPIRGIFWNEELMTPLLDKWFGISWEHHHAHSDEWISTFISLLGIGWMLSAALPFLMRLPRSKWLVWLLIPASTFLSIDSYARYADSGKTLGMALEFALQASAPAALIAYSYLYNGSSRAIKKLQFSWTIAAALALAATFIGHGLYAIGYHPVPGKFVVMTMEMLGCSEPNAKSLLTVMGALDFLCILALLIPKLRRLALIYMVLWGLATALARVITLFEKSQNYWGLDEGIAETLVRTSHWMIPLILLLLLPKSKPKPTSSTPT